MATYLGHQEDSSGNILLPTPHSMATQIEFGTTASQAYAKGAYVVFNNRLCKASTAIASGDTLAIGTNLVQCSIGSELNSHLQAPNGSEFYFDYKDDKPGFYPSASKVASEFVPFGGSEFLDENLYVKYGWWTNSTNGVGTITPNTPINMNHNNSAHLVANVTNLSNVLIDGPVNVTQFVGAYGIKSNTSTQIYYTDAIPISIAEYDYICIASATSLQNVVMSVTFS